MTAERNIESARTNAENVRQKLLVMLGWQYDARPEIRNIPAADMHRIEGMNPQADKDRALENNFSLKINQKKLANAQTANTIDSLEKTIKDNEQKIGSSLVTNYQNVLTARLAYEQAAAGCGDEKSAFSGNKLPAGQCQQDPVGEPAVCSKEQTACRADCRFKPVPNYGNL